MSDKIMSQSQYEAALNEVLYLYLLKLKNHFLVK